MVSFSKENFHGFLAVPNMRYLECGQQFLRKKTYSFPAYLVDLYLQILAFPCLIQSKRHSLGPYVSKLSSVCPTKLSKTLVSFSAYQQSPQEQQSHLGVKRASNRFDFSVSSPGNSLLPSQFTHFSRQTFLWLFKLSTVGNCIQSANSANMGLFKLILKFYISTTTSTPQ